MLEQSYIVLLIPAVFALVFAFFVGYLFRMTQEDLINKNHGNKVKEMTIAQLFPSKKK